MKTEITEYLDQLGVEYKVKQHAQPVFTSEDAARERGVRLSQIVKSMLLVGPEKRLFLAVLPGDLRLDLKAIKKLVGVKDLRLVDPKTLERDLNLTVGAIAPLGNAMEGASVFVDPAVFQEEIVDISSGDPEAGLELKSSNLKQLLKHATIAPITK